MQGGLVGELGAVGARGLGPGTSKLEIKVEPHFFYEGAVHPSIYHIFSRAAVGRYFF